MNNYPIGDFVIRLKNAAQARKLDVSIPYSFLKEEIAKVLLKEGYLTNVRREVKERLLIVTLSYKGKMPIFTGAKIVSKPGVRIYAKSKEIPLASPSLGVTLVSTSGGIMTGREAKKKGLGGEIIAQIW